MRETKVQSSDDGLPRIAASSYLNTAPLIWSFLHGTRRHVIRLVTDAAPARCADLLAWGEVDAALVPIIEYERIPEIRVVPDVCVGSHSAVRSVVLASKYDDLKKVRKVALDASSRTSQALIKIIFREFLGFEPQWESCSPDLAVMLKTNDAALIIGDPAMKISSKDLHIFDLATLWRQFTRVGFVFAMWMARASAAAVIRDLDLAGVRDEGLEHVDEIARKYEPLLGLSQGELITYLCDNICFSFDDDMQKGQELFFKLAYKHGIISNATSLKIIDE
ncbi:MAG TPA: menaquinone biosynthesis protein [Pyrinomonadaceae bacterium]|jgi:chorismate dehydratase